MLEYWKQLRIQGIPSTTADATKEPLMLTEQQLEERLFIRFGEDIVDIRKAFRHYGLDETINEDDK